jgi:ABC-type transporter Mla subunit MlaD
VSKDVERLSTDVSSAIVSANKSIDKVAADFSQTLTKADKVLDQIRAAAENMRTTLAPDSALRTELDRALQQIADASQSIGALVDLLRLYPNSLLVGREFPQKNK